MGIADDIKPRKYRRIVDSVKKEENPKMNDGDNHFFGQSQTSDSDFFDGTPIEKNIQKNQIKKKQKENSTKSYSWLYSVVIILVILSLVILIIWQNYPTIKSFLDGSVKEQNDQSLNEILNSTNDSINKTDENITANEESDQTPAESQAISSPTIDKASISISVLNGSGVKSAANTLAELLVADGFTIKYTGNARSFNYQNTIIYFKTGKDAEANLIKTSLDASHQTEIEESNTVTGNLYDIVVVAGKN